MAPNEDAAAAAKRKAEEAEAAPALKEAKTEKPAETNEDAAVDKRPALKEKVAFDARDITLNVIPSMGSRMLMTLSEGGMQYLLAGARANVGVKSGRYMFELKMVESLSTGPQPAAGGRNPGNTKALVRIGFSVGGSSLFLGGGAEHEQDGVCFDSDGFFITPGQKKKEVCGQRFGKDNVMAVVLNLDASSANANTISLYKDGVSASKPMPLPEVLRNKTLFPHVAFRSTSLQLHFGPEPLVALPFKCRPLQTAATADVDVAPSSMPKDGKFDVVFPIGVPEEGTFPWLEEFMKENPHFTELSDRKIVEWAQKSGIWKPKVQPNSSKSSNDKPEFNFGLPALDDLSARKVIQLVAPLVPRHYVVMEVRGNLMPSVRKQYLKRFNAAHYKRIAKVVVGKPNKEFRDKVLAAALKMKQDKLNFQFRATKAEKTRKRQIASRQKYLLEAKKGKEDHAAKRKAADKEVKEKRDAELAERKKAKGAAAADGKELTEEQKKETAEEEKQDDLRFKTEEEARKKADDEQAKKDEEDRKQKEEEERKAEEAEEEQMAPEKAELTEQEKNSFFPKRDNCDVSPAAIAEGLAEFQLPTDDEGFGKIDYAWDNAAASKEYLRVWMAERKISMRMEDLEPSQWFKSKHDDFQKALQDWQAKQISFRADSTKMAVVKLQEQRDAEKKEKEGEAGKKEGEAEKKEGEAKEGQAKEGEAAEKKEGETPAEEVDELSAGTVEVSKVEDICNIGNEQPLFLHFAFEDWALVSLRFEMWLLAVAYLHDTADPERLGIHDSHLAFYFNKYYKKQLNSKFFGADSMQKLVEMVKDTVKFDITHSVMLSQLQGGEDVDLCTFVKLTEEARRERSRRIEAGDETVRLKFNVMQMTTPPPQGSPDGKTLVPPSGDARAKNGPQGGKGGKDAGKHGPQGKMDFGKGWSPMDKGGKSWGKPPPVDKGAKSWGKGKGGKGGKY